MTGAWRRMVGVVLCLAMWLYPAPLQAQRSDDRVVSVETSDPEMTAAIRHARETLDEFLAASAAPAPETSNYRLKVMVRDGSAVEHFWVTPFRAVKDGFAGILANEPQSVHNVKIGQLFRFPREDISDWGYVKDGHQVGSFTVCALFKKMPTEQVELYRTKYGFDC